MAVKQETLRNAEVRGKPVRLGLGKEFIEKYINVPTPEGKAPNYGCASPSQFGASNK